VFRSCNLKEAACVIRSAIRGFIASIISEEDALFAPEECGNIIVNELVKRQGA